MLPDKGVNMDYKELEQYTWYEEDTPTLAQTQRYIQNVSNLRSVLHLPENTAEPPEDMIDFTITEANNIESILLTIQDWFLRLEQAWFYSGDLYSGEV